MGTLELQKLIISIHAPAKGATGETGQAINTYP